MTATLSRAEVRGRMSGLMAMAGFGFVWTAWGVSIGVPDTVRVPVLLVGGLVLLALIGTAVAVLRRAARLPGGSAADAEQGRRVGRRFGLVVAVEFAVAAAAAVALGVTGNERFVAAAVCLVVGAHFFPLRTLFNVPVYTMTGTVLCLVAVVTAVAVLLVDWPPLGTVLPGFAAAVVLFGTGIVLLRGARQMA